MTITIHRGTHQIGGCVTEIRSDNTRIFIDLGSELPSADGIQPEEKLRIPGVTEPGEKCDAVFFTHTHGDHIGQIGRIMPDVPLYMGEMARKICLILNRRLNSSPYVDCSAAVAALERAKTFRPGTPISVGAFRVTPLLVDHSAFDAYMFLIEAEGLKLLHTGDFRDHGPLGKALASVLDKYVGKVDALICEGTVLSRSGKQALSEQNLRLRARQIMMENKYIFVLCSSTNIDRIAEFYHARPDKRPVVCDTYQRAVLNIAEERGDGHGFYHFPYIIPLNRNNQKLLDLMNERGFLMFIRASEHFRSFMEPYRERCKIVYSMWDGYLDRAGGNQKLVEFLNGFDVVRLHTSGHAYPEAITLVANKTNPDFIIPIHTERPNALQELLPDRKVVLLRDGEKWDCTTKM